jgi:hypothetical protein
VGASRRNRRPVAVYADKATALNVPRIVRTSIYAAEAAGFHFDRVKLIRREDWNLGSKIERFNTICAGGNVQIRAEGSRSALL